jgi:hypothetical protein
MNFFYIEEALISLSHILTYKLKKAIELLKNLQMLHFHGINPIVQPQGPLNYFTRPYLDGHPTNTPKALKANVMKFSWTMLVQFEHVLYH